MLGTLLSTNLFVYGGDGCKTGPGINITRGGTLKPGIEPEMITATTVIGERVIGSNGKELGKIQEIAMDLTTGTISYFILSVGGIFGFANKLYAIPLDALTLDPEATIFYLDINKKALKQLPEIDKHNWPKKAMWPASDKNFKVLQRHKVG